MVFQFPNPSGRSSHGHPVRVRKKIPLITIRWFSHRPPRGGSAGRKPRSRSHSSSVRSWRFSRSGTVPIYTSRAPRSTGHALAVGQDSNYDWRAMNGPDHYREAERLLQEAESREEPDSRALWCLEVAKSHTALAQV